MGVCICVWLAPNFLETAQFISIENIQGERKFIYSYKCKIWNLRDFVTPSRELFNQL